MERNSSGALRAPGAFGASGTSDPHATLQICQCSLYITHVCSLAAVLRPSAAAPLTTRPAAAPAPPAPQQLFSPGPGHASLSESPFCSKSCASACSQRCCGRRPQHLWRHGLRPHRRLRRHSARPLGALRCCRIRLRWPATTPRPRAIPPNGSFNLIPT